MRRLRRMSSRQEGPDWAQTQLLLDVTVWTDTFRCSV